MKRSEVLAKKIAGMEKRISELQEERRALEMQKRQAEEQEFLKELREASLSRDEILELIRRNEHGES